MFLSSHSELVDALEQVWEMFVHSEDLICAIKL